jgi:hypothetical protein
MAAPVVLYRRETWAFGLKKERKTECQTACGDVKWIHLAQDIIQKRVRSCKLSGNFLTRCLTNAFSKTLINLYRTKVTYAVTQVKV